MPDIGIKATAPIDLLREFRVGFEAEAAYYRTRGKSYQGKAYAAENAVGRIDATLRDWA